MGPAAEAGADVDPHRVLGVPPGADQVTVRRAYRRLARTCHPDVGGSNAGMAQLNAAYAVMQGRRTAPGDARVWRRTAPPSPAPPDPAPRPSRRAGGAGAAGRRWAGRSRRWALTRRSGQWTLTACLALGIHALAPAGAALPTMTGLLEILVMGLALAVQASATPPGERFVPARDAATVLRILVRAARAVWRLLVEEASRCAAR